jgi:acid stress-induced BolA-like protein IbaG/YrbA
MDLREKVTDALRRNLDPADIRLKDDDGIYGIVVSDRFCDVTPLERQKLIYKALRSNSGGLSKDAIRRVLGIAALTPAEFAEHDDL